RMDPRIGQRGRKACVAGKALKVALGWEDRASFAAIDTRQQFGWAGPLSGNALAELRVGRPVSGRRWRQVKQGVELSRLLESRHPAGEAGQHVKLERQLMFVEQGRKRRS